MKTTLAIEFDIPEEQRDLETVVHAIDWRAAVNELDNQLRNWLKYGHEFSSADEALEKVRSFLYEILNADGLLID